MVVWDFLPSTVLLGDLRLKKMHCLGLRRFMTILVFAQGEEVPKSGPLSSLDSNARTVRHLPIPQKLDMGVFQNQGRRENLTRKSEFEDTELFFFKGDVYTCIFQKKNNHPP